MPISADPDDLLPYVLKIDRGKAVEPVFKLRYLPERKATAVDRLLDAADRCADEERRFTQQSHADGLSAEQIEALIAKAIAAYDRKMELLQQGIAIGLAEIENLQHGDLSVGVPELVPGKLELRDLLTFAELRELAQAVAGEPYLKERERLGFASPRASGPAPSAGPAPAADASTSPA